MNQLFRCVCFLLVCVGLSAQIHIQYNGGMTQAYPEGLHVYLIWYGGWQTTAPAAIPVIENFWRGYGATDRFKLNTWRTNASGVAPPAVLTLSGEVFDTSLTLIGQETGNTYSTGFGAVIEAHIRAGDLPRDPHAQYHVLVGPGTGTNYNCHCLGYHSYYTDDLSNKIVFAADFYQTQTAGVYANFPVDVAGPYLNGDRVSTFSMNPMVHELEEAMADPIPGTSYMTGTEHGATWSGGTVGGEVMDECYMTFHTLGTAPNGAPYDLQVGSLYYEIQAQWFDLGMKTGTCVDRLPVPLVDPNRTNFSSVLRGRVKLRGATRLHQ